MSKPQNIPPQHQNHNPGIESEMRPQPEYIREGYKGSGKLKGKVALVTGGDSGIGRAVCVHFAREGANVAIVYLNEHEDAQKTKKLVEAEGSRCLLLAGDIRGAQFCHEAIDVTVKELGQLDCLVNNAAEQHEEDGLESITPEVLEKAFQTNIFSQFYFTQAALKHLKGGSTIINTTSVNAYMGNDESITYSSTKGAILSFTRSLAKALMDKKIRVNAVAPGPIWTPFIPSAKDEKTVSEFGKSFPMKRAGQPSECAPAYVFLACEDSSYMSGQVLHPNGGKIVNA